MSQGVQVCAFLTLTAQKETPLLTGGGGCAGLGGFFGVSNPIALCPPAIPKRFSLW